MTGALHAKARRVLHFPFAAALAPGGVEAGEELPGREANARLCTLRL